MHLWRKKSCSNAKRIVVSLDISDRGIKNTMALKMAWALSIKQQLRKETADKYEIITLSRLYSYTNSRTLFSLFPFTIDGEW